MLGNEVTRHAESATRPRQRLRRPAVTGRVTPLHVEWVLTSDVRPRQLLRERGLHPIRHLPAVLATHPVALLIYVSHTPLMPPLDRIVDVLTSSVLAFHQAPRVPVPVQLRNGRELEVRCLTRLPPCLHHMPPRTSEPPPSSPRTTSVSWRTSLGSSPAHAPDIGR